MYYVNIAAAIGFIVLAILEYRKGSRGIAVFNTAFALANIAATLA